MFKLPADAPQPVTLKEDLLRGARQIADFFRRERTSGFLLVRDRPAGRRFQDRSPLARASFDPDRGTAPP